MLKEIKKTMEEEKKTPPLPRKEDTHSTNDWDIWKHSGYREIQNHDEFEREHSCSRSGGPFRSCICADCPMIIANQVRESDEPIKMKD